MILEARLKDDDDVYIRIDAEPSSGIDKGGSDRGYPDQALSNMLALIQQVTGRITELAQAEDGPQDLEVRFGVKVDGNALVSLSRNVASAQLQVTARWNRS